MAMIELLLKNMGLDPAEMKRQIDGASDTFKEMISHFNNRLDDIERKINALTPDRMSIVLQTIKDCEVENNIAATSRFGVADGKSHE